MKIRDEIQTIVYLMKNSYLPHNYGNLDLISSEAQAKEKLLQFIKILIIDWENNSPHNPMQTLEEAILSYIDNIIKEDEG